MRELAGAPPEDIPVPEGLLRVLNEHGLERSKVCPIWLNEAGGLTFAITSGAVEEPASKEPAEFYAKWNARESGESLADELERLNWLSGRHPAPKPVVYSADSQQEILITRALSGESAVAPSWVADPDTTLRALGRGLRRLHDLPIDDCPFEWSVETRLLIAGADVDSVGEIPSIDRLVVCQGDPCAPNTLIGADGRFVAHVDLARLGTADRWADLAVMSLSLQWNYRDYEETVFWDAYGVEPDLVRIDFYRRLWDAT